MKVTDRKFIRICRWIALAGMAAAVFAIQIGCASSTPVFDGPDIRVTGVRIPVPGPRLQCYADPERALPGVTLLAVEEDGSIIIQACTQDVLTLDAARLEYAIQCESYNEAREGVVAAQAEAEAELKRLQDELEGQ